MRTKFYSRITKVLTHEKNRINTSSTWNPPVENLPYIMFSNYLDQDQGVPIGAFWAVSELFKMEIEFLAFHRKNGNNYLKVQFCNGPLLYPEVENESYIISYLK